MRASFRALWFCWLFGLFAISSEAFASPEMSSRWFSSLSPEERLTIQTNLVLLGLYNGLVDGEFGPGTYKALSSFQASRGLRQSGVLSDDTVDSLQQLADYEAEELELVFVDDLAAMSVVPVPKAYLPLSELTESGTRYYSSAHNMTMWTYYYPSGTTPFSAAYQTMQEEFSNLGISYQTINDSRFVISGGKDGARFYMLMRNDQDAIRGYGLIWPEAIDQTGGALASFLASYFLPLYSNDLPGQSNPPKEAAANPELSPESLGDNTGMELLGSIAIFDDEPNLIALTGEITSSTPLEMRRALKARPNAKVLILNSPGGLVDSALIVAHDLAGSGLATYVPEGLGCYSACSFIYFAGTTRAVDGELGVHQVWSEANDLVSGQAKLGDVLDALVEFGVSQNVISTMLRTPPDKMHVLTPDQVIDWAVEAGDIDAALGY